MLKRVLIVLAVLLFSSTVLAQDEKPPTWHASGWCTLGNSDGGWCDVGVAVSIMRWKVERIDRYMAIVGGIGEGDTIALGLALVIRTEDPTIAAGLGGSARYTFESGIDLSTAKPVIGLTLSF